MTADPGAPPRGDASAEVPAALTAALAEVPVATRGQFVARWRRHPPRQLVLPGGGQLEYVACGTGSRVLVHLPGLLSDARAAVHLAPLLDRFTLLTPTYLATTDVDAQVDAVIRMLDAEAAPRAAILGQTLGGYLGQLVASAHPSRISHLVLAHAGAPEPDQMPSLTAMYRAVQLLPFSLTSAYITRTLLAGVARAGRHPEIDPAQARLIAAYFRYRQSELTRRTAVARYGLSHAIGGAFARYRDRLRAWPGKTLVCYGHGMWCNERHVERLRALHAEVTAQRCDVGGHWNLYLQPEAAARLVDDFVTG